ncbi:MAG: hypothetical protein LBV43_04670 [Prevotella sp.]|jgi:hypothetical protein|nr:hypothetical protein [Prevotella sp.]
MFLKSLLWSFPNFIQDNYLSYKYNKQYRKWISAGKPLPPVHIVKQQRIAEYKKKYNIDILVETGTYLGDMIWAQRKNFAKIYSIELSKTFADLAKKRFKKQTNITIIEGDSGVVLNLLIGQIDKKAIFWLDGHYSGGNTACANKECPIYEELNAIFKSDIDHILLIDDARCFVGTGSYPTIEELSGFISDKYTGSSIHIDNDCIIVELSKNAQ